MPGKKPTPAQADLYLKLYDLRREAKLRAARDWYFKNYRPQSLDDHNRLCPMGSEENAYFRMTISYWEMACAFLNCGLLHEDFFFETTGEQYMIWERVKPIVPVSRQQFGNPRSLQHLEKAAQRYEKWMNRRAPGALEKMRKFMAAAGTAPATR